MARRPHGYDLYQKIGNAFTCTMYITDESDLPPRATALRAAVAFLDANPKAVEVRVVERLAEEPAEYLLSGVWPDLTKMT